MTGVRYLGATVAALLASASLSLCRAAGAPMRWPSAAIPFVAYDDPWPKASERWWDIFSYEDARRSHYNQYNEWLTNGVPNGRFDYRTRAAAVHLVYDRRPSGPYFVGYITAHGLKPNFAYQVKLAGKPVSGQRGFGTKMSYVTAATASRTGSPIVHLVRDATGQPTAINGDDWSNQQLGYAGRWWDDSNPSNNTNAINDEDFQLNTTDTIYGYIFIGDFVTDKYGNADQEIIGDRSYHVTWQEWQIGSKHVPVGKFTAAAAPATTAVAASPSGATAHYYGYGAQPPSSGLAQEDGQPRMSLFYEWEWDRLSFVVLPRGTYHCRLLITEESFHNGTVYATEGTLGGTWKTVMSTERFPDNDPTNDIVFTVS